MSFIWWKKFESQQQVERRNGWINVGDLQGAVHFKIVKYERIKFLVIALKDSIEIYAWAPKPYHKFMAFKVSFNGNSIFCRNAIPFSLSL